jgi:AcrR family transcriptional regulator
MGSNERRERERLELRTKILDAARELFVEHGYDAVTMRKIAQKIEYSPTAIYAHFKEKHQLLKELVEGDYLALAQEFQKILTIANPVERLAAGGRAYLAYAISHPNHYRLMFMTPEPFSDEEPEHVEKGNINQDSYAFVQWTVKEAIEQGLLRPEHTDVDLITQVVWAGVHGIAALYIAKHCDKWVDWRPPEKTADVLIEALLRGLKREGT